MITSVSIVELVLVLTRLLLQVDCLETAQLEVEILTDVGVG